MNQFKNYVIITIDILLYVVYAAALFLSLLAGNQLGGIFVIALPVLAFIILSVTLGVWFLFSSMHDHLKKIAEHASEIKANDNKCCKEKSCEETHGNIQ